MEKRINELTKHGIKFEEIWIDAGWFGNGDISGNTIESDWTKHVGDWYVNINIHPDNLKTVSKCVQDNGMRLMLWFEPERAMEGTEIVKNHPEWFLKLPNTKGRILNYGNKEALGYIFKLISNHIKDLNLLCYRQDFNTDLTSFFKVNDEENRRGITEIKHIMGMYELWDGLLQKYPDLIIDNCSSGGRRIDIETLKRSIPFFRSDYQCFFNANAEVLQIHNTNASAYFPYMGCTSKIKNDTYAIRSSYSSSWGGAFYNTIFQSMNEEDFKWAKQITDEYRKIRKYFSMDFYNHGSNKFDSTAWTIWQYHDNETQSGIVMAFRRKNSPFDNVEIQLKSTVENQEYLFNDLNTGNTFIGSNAIKIHLPQKQSSVIMEYKLK
jgi:alpha-galactosidase